MNSSKTLQTNNLICNVCNVTCLSPFNFTQHLNGAKHNKKLKLLQCNQTMTPEDDAILKNQTVNTTKDIFYSDSSVSVQFNPIKSDVGNNLTEKIKHNLSSTVTNTKVKSTQLYYENNNISVNKNRKQTFEALDDGNTNSSLNHTEVTSTCTNSNELSTYVNYSFSNVGTEEDSSFQQSDYLHNLQVDPALLNMIKTDHKMSSKTDIENVNTSSNNEEKINFNNSNLSAFNVYYVHQINYEKQVDALKPCLTKMKSDIKKEYPEYNNYFKQILRKYNNDFCEIKEQGSVPLVLLRQNSWKFKCIKASVKTSNENLIQIADSTTSTTYIWKIRSLLNPEVDIEIDSQYPYYIINIVKILEEFFNSYLISCSQVYDDNTIDILLQSNSKDHVMVLVTVYNNFIDLHNCLQDFVYDNYMMMMNLKSLYYVIDISGREKLYRKIILFGEECLDDLVGNIKVSILPKTCASLNYNYIQILTEKIEHYLQSYKDTVLFELNCKHGLSSLLLSSKFKEVVGFGSSINVQEIEKIRQHNNIQNASFETDEIKCATELNLKVHDCVPINAIINNDQQCDKFYWLLDKILKMITLRRLVIITQSFDQITKTLLKVMKPENAFAFVPVSCVIVDKLLQNDSCEYVIFMERKSLESLKKSSFIKNCQNTSVTDWENELLNSTSCESNHTSLSHVQMNQDSQVNFIDVTSASSSDDLDEIAEEIADTKNEELKVFCDYIFDELTNSIPDVEVIDCNGNEECNAPSMDYAEIEEIKVPRTPSVKMDNEHNSRKLSKVYETEKKNFKMNKVKTISYSKRLKSKLDKIITYINNCSASVNQVALMESKMMLSSMLHTGLKIEKILNIGKPKQLESNKDNMVMTP